MKESASSSSESLYKEPLQIDALPLEETENQITSVKLREAQSAMLLVAETVAVEAVVAPQIMPVTETQKQTPQSQIEAMLPKKDSKLQLIETAVRLPGLSGMVEPNLAVQARRGNRSVMASSVANALSLKMIETTHKILPSVVVPALKTSATSQQIGSVRRRNSQKLASDTGTPAGSLQQVETKQPPQQ